MRDEELHARFVAMFGSDPFRPREDWEQPGEPGEPHPDSFRGQALALREVLDRALERMRPWLEARRMVEARGNVWRANRLPRHPRRRKHRAMRRRCGRG